MGIFKRSVSKELSFVPPHWGWLPPPNLALHRCRMPSRNPSRLFFWLQGLAVVLLTVLVVGLMFQRHTWADWNRPQWLEGDPVEVYTRVKIAGEQPGHALLRFNHIARLGAPTDGDWTAYPAPDRLVFVLTGLLG